MQFNFFATEEDAMRVWALLLAVSGVVVAEMSSRPDQPLRLFDSIGDIRAAIASDPHILLGALPTSVGAAPQIETVRFTEEYAAESGHEGRQTLHCPAIITFVRWQYTRTEGCLSNSYLSGWDEAGARRRLPAAAFDAIDWKSFASILRKTKRDIAKLAPAKLDSAPVLPDAFRKLQAAEIRLWGWGEAVSIPSSRLIIAAT